MYIQSLDGKWQVRKLEEAESYPATVPGNIHVDLMAAGVIPDPLVSDNENRISWVAESDWIYARTFEIKEELLKEDRLFLECDGLDTIAIIRVNDNEIARTNNMHRRYEFDLTKQCRPGLNTLEIEFLSPVREAIFKVQPDDLVIAPPESIPGSPYFRKAMYQWGWDWAPRLPTSGIWRSIRLVGRSIAKLNEIYIEQSHHDNNADISLQVPIERYSHDKLIIRAKITSPDGEIWQQSAKLHQDSQGASFQFQINNPKLWWPNDLGEQPLYQAQIELLQGDSTEEKVVDSCSKRIGLRVLKLKQEQDQWGRSFYFEVNGVPVFSKGADWIPADQFPSRITPDEYRDLISSAYEAHMNMLRVWGGGFYESDLFYDLCDEYGILIWQDFMFACAQYPIDPEMLENIRLEAIDNIQRIRHHACLALWCGNNEMEWFLARGWAGEGDEQRKVNYDIIFHQLLPKICDEADPATPYWPSSPGSGIPFADPNGENEGDGHYWEVWHGRVLFTAYRQRYFRFMSEFGFQSMPSVNTVASFAKPDDWNITSYVMESHQKSYVGNGQIIFDMMQIFQLPEGFPMLVYVSQVLQAEAIKYGVEHWRRHRNGNHCMGTLYWQLNDCWPVASWSSIEYNHHWKALHYYAKKFYAPVLLSAEENGPFVNLHITNDYLEPFKGDIHWSLETLSGVQIDGGQETVEIPGSCSQLITKLDFTDKLDFDTQRDMVLVYELKQAEKHLNTGMVSFVPSKHLKLEDPMIKTSISEQDGHLIIKLLAKNTARFVMLDVADVEIRFNDNFFDLPANREITINVLDSKALSAEEFAGNLRITSLRDSY